MKHIQGYTQLVNARVGILNLLLFDSNAHALKNYRIIYKQYKFSLIYLLHLCDRICIVPNNSACDTKSDQNLYFFFFILSKNN